MWEWRAVGDCKMTLHQSTIFTMCLFNTQPIYSCQIFSQRPSCTVVPSQTPASDGIGSFTLQRAARRNTPYPLALKLPSTLHTCKFRTLPPHPPAIYHRTVSHTKGSIRWTTVMACVRWMTGERALEELHMHARTHRHTGKMK